MRAVNAAEQACTAVRELRDAVGWLAATLMPGTHKPYRAPTVTPQQRADRDREARLERLDRVGIAPGETPAPLDLDVADLLVETLTTVDELCDRACRTLGLPLPRPAASAFADVGPYIALLLRLLPDAVAGDAGFAREVEGRCDALVYRTHATLGLFGDGQKLGPCFSCGGRTAAAPAGGADTLRVRAELPPGKRSVAGVDPADVEWWAVCEGAGCDPRPEDCGNRLRGRPAWSLRTEGAWLAGRLEHATELAERVAALVNERTAS